MDRKRAEDDTLRGILERSRTVAVVGLSPRPERDSHRVASYLKRAGYRVVPVNPNASQILGERAWPTLDDVPEPLDLVDVFRRAEEVPALVDAAIRRGVCAFWMQLGIRCEESAKRLRAAGIEVVQDRCTLVEHQRLLVRGAR